MENILVSVIVPFYNNSIFLKDSLQSVCRSTYKNIEILVVNDGSDENIDDILDSLADSRIKYYRKLNGGVSSARNFGMEIIHGEIVMFMDPDDLMSPTIIEKCVDEFYSKKVDAVVFGYLQKTEVEGKLIVEEKKYLIVKYILPNPFQTSYMGQFIECLGFQERQ